MPNFEIGGIYNGKLIGRCEYIGVDNYHGDITLMFKSLQSPRKTHYLNDTWLENNFGDDND